MYGVSTPAGKWLIPAAYSKIYRFGEYYVCNTEKSCTFYNSKGEVVKVDLHDCNSAAPISDKLLLAIYDLRFKAIIDYRLTVKIKDLTGVDGYAKSHLQQYRVATCSADKTYGAFDDRGTLRVWDRDEVKIEEDQLLCRTGDSWEVFDLSGGGLHFPVLDEKRTLEAEARRLCDLGDRYVREQKYWDAAMEYSKAIEKGFKNYIVFYKRASAFYKIEFYNNAIDDYTSALSFEEKEEAYLYRGLAKLRINDNSGIEDLRKGGPEGASLAKEFAPSGSNTPSVSYTASGTGFFIDKHGYIVTNYHVIESVNSIDVFIKSASGETKHKASVVISDKTNDLAIIKIQYDTPAEIPYTISNQSIEVGTGVFAMGYPMITDLGEEIKITDGIISSKTGYQGDVSTYQISAPIQPGNSGGPLFDKSGRLIGITSSGVPDLQNIGYAIKVSYLSILIDSCNERIVPPSINRLSGKAFTEQIKQISPYIVIIKVK